MKKILIGMSGGVDSSAAAVILKSEGYEVSGATLRLLGSTPTNDEADAKNVCDKLGINHKILDLHDEFRRSVIDEFISEYECGRTPNPCVTCNRLIKLGLMLDIALSEGFDGVATGHYARVQKSGDRYLLKKGLYAEKDQSYMLYSLSQKQLSHLILPLGALTKEEVRDIADKAGLINSRKKDSQDICFVPDGDYAGFIEETTNKQFEKGNFITADGEILGEHSGVIRYTIGQRKGLGIAVGHPIFVLDKNANDNTVTLGLEDGLFYKRVRVERVNFIPFDTLNGDIRVEAKLRYRHSPQPATLHPDGDGVIIEFDTPQRAPSAGQSAVFYDGDTVIGGGIIINGIK